MKIIFLDRDGVINKFPGMGEYVTAWKKFRFLPNSKKALAFLTKKGYAIYIVSNQGGVSRGRMTLEDLNEMTSKMLASVRKAGGNIKEVLYCTHQTSDRCGCKKPKTELFKKALRGKKVNLKSIFFIGDSREDMEAGRNLGCRTLLVLSGRTRRADIAGFPVEPDAVKKNLWEAVRWITQKKS